MTRSGPFERLDTDLTNRSAILERSAAIHRRSADLVFNWGCNNSDTVDSPLLLVCNRFRLEFLV